MGGQQPLDPGEKALVARGQIAEQVHPGLQGMTAETPLSLLGGQLLHLLAGLACRQLVLVQRGGGFTALLLPLTPFRLGALAALLQGGQLGGCALLLRGGLAQRLPRLFRLLCHETAALLGLGQL